MSWYYLDPTGLHTGPCNVEDFKGKSSHPVLSRAEETAHGTHVNLPFKCNRSGISPLERGHRVIFCNSSSTCTCNHLCHWGCKLVYCLLSECMPSDSMCIMTGLYEGGYVTAETLAWADGRKDWGALKSIPEIWDTLATATAGAPAAPQSAPDAVQSGSGSTSAPALAFQDAQQAATGAGQQPARRKVAVVAKAAKATPAQAAPEDSELAAFQAEMSALGAVPVPGAVPACAWSACPLSSRLS